jgi:hypothetical protein
VPTGWFPSDNGDKTTFPTITGANRERTLNTIMRSRSYFAENCTAGRYDHNQYLALNLLGKTMRYTTDIRGAGCGCNAAMYLTSLKQNARPSTCSDYYCDANNVCGESCAEIDIQEANMYSWHSTLHTKLDHGGLGKGYGGGDGWDGPRDFDATQYGPNGQCVNTQEPFQVEVSFPVDASGSLQAMVVKLTQKGRSCPISVSLDSYKGMSELSTALSAGMTPIVSYWKSNNMLWMDGAGADGKGPCAVDHAATCADVVKFYDFAVEAIPSSAASALLPQTTVPPAPPAPLLPQTTVPPAQPIQAAGTWVLPAGGASAIAAPPSPAPAPLACSRTQKEDCSKSHCCLTAGMQCYKKDTWWAACKASCTPGSLDPEDTGDARTPWSCKALGSRTPGRPALSGETMVVRVRTPSMLPDMEAGTVFNITYLGQNLKAAVVKAPGKEASARGNLGNYLSHVMQRWEPSTGARTEHRWNSTSATSWKEPRGSAAIVVATLLACSLVSVAALRVHGGGSHGRLAPHPLLAGRPASTAGESEARAAFDEGDLEFNIE